MNDRKGVPHPMVSEWLGERSYNDPEFVCWDTFGDSQPTISHNRDFMMNRGLIEQDYNFIDYAFGAGDRQVVARIYLDDPYVAMVVPLPGEALGEGTLDYLKKRFREIKVLGEDGYRTVWEASRVRE